MQRHAMLTLARALHHVLGCRESAALSKERDLLKTEQVSGMHMPVHVSACLPMPAHVCECLLMPVQVFMPAPARPCLGRPLMVAQGSRVCLQRAMRSSAHPCPPVCSHPLHAHPPPPAFAQRKLESQVADGTRTMQRLKVKVDQLSAKVGCAGAFMCLYVGRATVA